MISFIIIGKNEEKNLTRCINRVIETINYNALAEYEIIYVDSNSTDNSIAVVERFPLVRILKVTGYCSVAIGRNVGAEEAKGDILYFLDADMEICPDFLTDILDEQQNLKYDLVSGVVT